MGTASPPPRLECLRRTLAEIDPSNAPRLPERARLLSFGAGPIDASLGGGLAGGALHEFAPAAPVHLAAATGFATALAARAGGQMLWIATDYAAREGGGAYGPGLDRHGFPASRLLMLRVPHPVDVLWAMEEALRCRAIGSVIAELTGAGADADLTATRRLTLAARAGSGFGFLLRHGATVMPSAAATRWIVAAAPSRPDVYGGLGRTTFDLSLIKNRRGPSGRWNLTWDHHERTFHAPLSLGVAAPAADRSDRASLAHAG